jgi:DNA-binding transcriptional LysR family regulator
MDLIDRVAYRLKLRDLRLFETVVRVGSMAKAANQLHLSQPAVSKAVAEMEQMLGVRLIDRGRLGVEPTPHGRALLKSGVAIFDQLRHGVREIEFLSDPTVGEVRIATAEPYAAGLVPSLIASFSRQYPRVSVYVIQTPIGSLPFRAQRYRDLHERNVDLVLGPIIEPFVEDGLEAETLFKERTVVVAGSQSPWTRRRAITLADLIDEPWCLPPPDTFVGSQIVGAFRASGLAVPEKTVVSISIQLQTGLLATQRYLSMLPQSLMRFSAKRFALKQLPIEPTVPLTTVGIITVKNRTINPVARLFIEAAREVTKPLSKLN